MKTIFLGSMETMDKSWMYLHDPETKEMSKERKHTTSLCPKKTKVQKSAGKFMLSVFQDCRPIILTDYLAKGQTISSKYNCTLLNKLRDALKEKRCSRVTKGVGPLAI